MNGSLLRQILDVATGILVFFRQSIGSLRENRMLGFLAIGLSALLWVLISLEQNPPRTEPFGEPISIRIVNVPSGLYVFGDVEPIRARVTAPVDVWERMRADDFIAVADLQGTGVGTHEIVPKVESRDARIRVVSFTPNKIPIRLEVSKSKVVPVKLEMKGAVPFGFTADPPEFSLSQATVQGPESLIDQVDVVSADIDLEGRRLEINQSFVLRARNAQGYEIDGVSINPSLVQVKIPIKQQVFYRTMPINVVLEGDVSPGYGIESITVDPATTTVVGNREAVEAITRLDTKPININAARSTLVTVAEIVLPKDANLAGDQRVIVRVSIAPIKGARRIPVVPEIKGLAPTRRAILDVEAVNVTLFGPVPTLATLSPSQLKATLDLTDFEPGIYAVTPSIVVPPELQIEAVEPSVVHTTIR